MNWLASVLLWDDYQNEDPGTFQQNYQAGKYAGASRDVENYIRWDHGQNEPGDSDPFMGSKERSGANYSTDDGTACW